MELKPIHQQVVAVVGAYSGIGRETAIQFAKKGALVVVSARSEAGLKSLVDEIQGFGGKAVYILADVANFDEVEAMQRVSPSLVDNLLLLIGFLTVPSLSDWLEKNQAVKLGAIASAAGLLAIATIATQFLNQTGEV